MDYEKVINRTEELLRLCQKLQSEKDGVDRAEPGIVDKTKTLDQFALDIRKAITYVIALHDLMPMNMELAELGRLLERKGKISVEQGGIYSRAALDYILSQYGLKSEGK